MLVLRDPANELNFTVGAGFEVLSGAELWICTRIQKYGTWRGGITLSLSVIALTVLNIG